MGDLEQKLKNLPAQPGVYIYRNAEGQIIYVGKAVSLKNRVSSYFQQSSKSAKVQAMVAHIDDLEYIVTDSEVEALILECNLIKENRPYYNICLKDDKNYPYIKVTLKEEYPRVYITRSLIRDGSRYFGPYTQVYAVNETMKLLHKIFPLRTCRNSQVVRKDRPCLNQHIDRCLAPCCGMTTPQEYGEMIGEVIQFLEGKHSSVRSRIQERMLLASEKMDYEKAAEYRDQLSAMDSVLEKQKIVSEDADDHDIIAYARDEERCCVQVFFIRGGKVIGREHFFLAVNAETEDSEVLTAFVQQFYNNDMYIPPVILLQQMVDNQELIKKWLGQIRGGRVTLKMALRGEKARLMSLVSRNAQLMLEQEKLTELSGELHDPKEALNILKDQLKLPCFPHRMECYDISNIQGAETVASMVVFEDGMPARHEYRRFRIQSVDGPNDFASMQEVISRRFKRATLESEELKAGKIGPDKISFSRLPDLIIIDGGKGQLNAAREAMRRLGYDRIPAFGLAKEEELLFAEDRSEPYRLSRDSIALQVVQRLRDEAHRFAITYHRQLRGKRNLKSLLDEIEGIGDIRRRNLMQRFRDLNEIKNSTVEDLAAVPGMNRKAAEKVYNYFH